MATLAMRLGEWVPSLAIAQAVFRESHHQDLVAYEFANIRTHIWRTRQKLQDTRWRIENRPNHGLYRLVEHPEVLAPVRQGCARFDGC